MNENDPKQPTDDAKRVDDGEYARFLRAATAADDGYDPFSDRPAEREPLFERDPWA